MKRQKTAIVVASVACVAVLCSTIHAGIFGKRSACKKADPCPADQYSGHSGYFPTTWRPWPKSQPNCYGTGGDIPSAYRPSPENEQTTVTPRRAASVSSVVAGRPSPLVPAKGIAVSLAHAWQSEPVDCEAILILPAR